ncbi:MAG: hypothetical protein ABI480_02820 [Chitinophagaceae bacterium]
MSQKINNRRKVVGAITVLLIMLLVNSQLNGQMIKGRLTSWHKTDTGNLVKGLKVIIVPRTPTNEKIVDNNFFWGDDQQQLNNMKAMVAFTDEEGYYYFSGVTTGRYILKVCYAYGMMYKFKIPDSNYKAMLIKNLPATYN